MPAAMCACPCLPVSSHLLQRLFFGRREGGVPFNLPHGCSVEITTLEGGRAEAMPTLPHCATYLPAPLPISQCLAEEEEGQEEEEVCPPACLPFPARPMPLPVGGGRVVPPCACLHNLTDCTTLLPVWHCHFLPLPSQTPHTLQRLSFFCVPLLPRRMPSCSTDVAPLPFMVLCDLPACPQDPTMCLPYHYSDLVGLCLPYPLLPPTFSVPPPHLCPLTPCLLLCAWVLCPIALCPCLCVVPCALLVPHCCLLLPSPSSRFSTMGEDLLPHVLPLPTTSLCSYPSTCLPPTTPAFLPIPLTHLFFPIWEEVQGRWSTTCTPPTSCLLFPDPRRGGLGLEKEKEEAFI